MQGADENCPDQPEQDRQPAAREEQGNAAGPCGGGCNDHWTYGYCAELPCSHHATCDDCLASEVCGWCASRQQCMAGSDAEPLHLSCPAGYRYQTCAGRELNATFVDL